MIKVSVTKLRNDLFSYIHKLLEGEIIVIQRNNKDIGRIIPSPHLDWRIKMTTQPKILVSAENLMQPLEDLWGDLI